MATRWRETASGWWISRARCSRRRRSFGRPGVNSINSGPSASLNIGIAGAGLVGRLLAWRLLRQGHRVTLFDDGPGDGENAAGLIAAAMVAPCSEIIAAERAVYQPGLQALAQWPQWLTELRGDSAIEVSFQRRGSLVIAHPTDQADL